MTYIGIDVSKDTFVVAYSPDKNSKTKTFKNTTRGIHEFIRTISKDEHHCVMEATGNYSALLVYLLSEAGITTSLENPLKVKNFARAMLSTVKTDEIDARLIALYGEKMQPAPYKLRSDAILTLKQKRTVIRQLKKQLIATKNLKSSMEALPFFDAKCRKSVEKTIAFLEKQVKDLEEDLLTRHLGLSPTYQQSGTSVNFKGHINRNGDSSLRSQLYVAAFSSIRCNTECRACYDRLRSKGKPGKVAVIAVANKLIRQAFAVVTQEKPYVDGYISSKK